MKNAIRMLVAVLLAASQAYSQAPPPTFSLKLVVSPSNAKAGSNVVMEVDVTNISKKRIGLQVCLGQTVECNFDIYARDSHGNSPPETRYLKAVRHEDTGYPHLISAPSIAGTSLEPGETIKFSSDLPKLFDLSRPDCYEFHVETRDPYTDKTVQSNVSQLVVSAQ